MVQQTLNLSCIGRDALVRDWLFGELWATVTAYRVFETENGYGVAGQSVKLDLQTQHYEREVAPVRLVDGLESFADAVAWMRRYAQWYMDMLKELYHDEGIEVLEAAVVSDEGDVWIQH